MKTISIVTSLYRSSPYIREFIERHLASTRELGLQCHFVFVNDGSPDDSADVVRELFSEFKNITLVDFSKNYGQYPAMFAAMAYATGDYICALDADLEEAPENLVPMFKVMQNDPNIDVVYSVVDTRSGGFIRGRLGNLFFKILTSLSEVHIPPRQGWQRIMTKRFVESLLRYNEAETLPAGLMCLTGYKQVPYSIEKPYKGSTTYTFRRRLAFALNSLTAFSSKPLTFVGLAGVGISCVAFLVILFIVVKKLCFVDYQAGWISMIASVWLVGGLILSSIGLVGIYLAKVFNQVKGRPLYTVRSVEQS